MKRSSRNIADAVSVSILRRYHGHHAGYRSGLCHRQLDWRFVNGKYLSCFAYITGAVVNFAIPSAGGEFAVWPQCHPGGAGSRCRHAGRNGDRHDSQSILSVAYGESSEQYAATILSADGIAGHGSWHPQQPDPVMAGLVIPTLLFIVVQLLMVVYWPI